MSEWADAERRLSPESSAEPGRWRTSRAEYLRGLMDAINEAGVTDVCAVLASQVGKTEVVNNLIGYHVHHDPAPMLLLQPTLEVAEAWSKDRLAPMVRDTPALAARIAEARSRDKSNTVRHKTFPGGHITAAGANSPASLSSRPIRFLLCDEVDGYQHSAGTEGNPIRLAATRTVAFWNARRVYISTPRNKGSSLIEPIWERSDQRRYFVPCHACGHMQHLRWNRDANKRGGVHWDRDDAGKPIPKTARYQCEACDAHWNDAQRWQAVRKGEWRATKPFNGTAGFHLTALAAPWESRRLEALVGQFVEAQQSPEALKVFVNTVLAEWWSEKYTAIEPKGLLARREHYPQREGRVLVPKGVAVMTAGVDVQDDRIEVQVQGYGRGHEQWKLRYHVLDGDPSGPLVWEALWELLCKPLPMARGGVDWIRATCVDTGAHALRAYDFCRPRFRYALGRGPDGRARRAYVFAIKGKDGQAESLWPKVPSRSNKGRIPLYIVRVDTAKELLYASLTKIQAPGPNYIHFPLEVSVGEPFGQVYFDQLTAEQVSDERAPNGMLKRVWKKRSEGRRNEALDTSIYGEAALRGLMAMGLDLDREVRRTERWIEQAESGLVLPESADELAPTVAPIARKKKPGRRIRRSSWLDRE